MFAVLMINLQSTLSGRKIAGAFLYAEVVGHIYHPLASVFLLINYLTSVRNLTSNHKPKEKLDFNLQKLS